ncbi:hypothetical protein [Haliangium ochraceum]|uniref:Uncharacterized protein n=1 Tax=Haliangium ochraceum (strain DSM 14365 / JCM 11303 / SMP-2) TaxID=502025 RepID=D0LLP8_HALO1|nr:hypothetical protein [Haliangium ochraceum]ACY13265.1 conserved hypothetical protein [Haliangium ochraceum DSM 14365]
MSRAWNTAKEMADKHANAGGIFIRLTDSGDKIVGAFLGDPYPREVVWTGQRYELFDENDPAHQSKRPSLRVMLNFYVPADDAVKIIEGGTAWFKDVLKVRDKYGLDRWLFEIERHGGPGDPKTSYTILPEEKIDGSLHADLAVAELHDLKALALGSNPAPEAHAANERLLAEAQQPPPPSPSDLLDPRVAGALVAQLKTLRRSDLDAFLAEFGVQRVRDLKNAQVPAARAFIEARLAQYEQPAETDPFA